jgi:hypothetical protein
MVDNQCNRWRIVGDKVGDGIVGDKVGDVDRVEVCCQTENKSAVVSLNQIL